MINKIIEMLKIELNKSLKDEINLNKARSYKINI